MPHSVGKQQHRLTIFAYKSLLLETLVATYNQQVSISLNKTSVDDKIVTVTAVYHSNCPSSCAIFRNSPHYHGIPAVTNTESLTSS